MREEKGIGAMSDRIDEEQERKRGVYEERRATGDTEGGGEGGARSIGERLNEGAKGTSPVKGEAGGVRRDTTEERVELRREGPGAMTEEGEARLIRDYRVTPDYAGKTFTEGDRHITPQGIRSDVERGAEGGGERIKEGVEGMAVPFRREVTKARPGEIAERGSWEGGEEAGARERTPEDADLERRIERSTAIPPIGDLDSIERARRAKGESERESEHRSSRDYETGGTSGFGSEDAERHASTTGAFGMTAAGGTRGTDRISDTGESKMAKERDAERERDERA